MSADEDTELRDLVAQSLETNGVLGKIKAQLRASVFLALEEQEAAHNKSPLQNPELKKFLSTKEGRNAACLVREFLEYFNLDFSVAVFEPESGVNNLYQGRRNLAKDLGATEETSQPLLATILRQVAPDKSIKNGESFSVSTIPKDLSPKQIAAAKTKFEQYDADKNGTIEKNELRNLFCDIFPGFHKNMLDRYVNDEFRAADTDFSNGAIDFEEFLGMYKRLFILCRSVVSSDMTELISPRQGPNSPPRIPSPTHKIPDDLGEEAAFSFSSSVETKNKKNEKTDSRSGAKSPTDKQRSHSTTNDKQRSHSTTSDKQDDDSFFDDPLPSLNEKSLSRSGSKSPRPSQIPVKSRSVKNQVKDNGQGCSPLPANPDSDKTKDKQDLNRQNPPKPGGFLVGAPPLTGANKQSKDPDFDKEFKNIDRSLADLGYDVPDDDYDDDFDSSNVSPVGQTPRSARSDHNVQSIDEEIEEDIEENLDNISIGSDLLKSENSAADDLTTDRTVSPTEQSTVFDYAEEISLP